MDDDVKEENDTEVREEDNESELGEETARAPIGITVGDDEDAEDDDKEGGEEERVRAAIDRATALWDPIGGTPCTEEEEEAEGTAAALTEGEKEEEEAKNLNEKGKEPSSLRIEGGKDNPYAATDGPRAVVGALPREERETGATGRLERLKVESRAGVEGAELMTGIIEVEWTVREEKEISSEREEWRPEAGKVEEWGRLTSADREGIKEQGEAREIAAAEQEEQEWKIWVATCWKSKGFW